jgi:hypothetical protein
VETWTAAQGGKMLSTKMFKGDHLFAGVAIGVFYNILLHKQSYVIAEL